MIYEMCVSKKAVTKASDLNVHKQVQGKWS